MSLQELLKNLQWLGGGLAHRRRPDLHRLLLLPPRPLEARAGALEAPRAEGRLDAARLRMAPARRARRADLRLLRGAPPPFDVFKR